jgi:thiol-disulfide isomerase/thioredoxin
MIHQILVVPFLLVVLFCPAQNKELPDGQWRAVLERADGHDIVFNFQVTDSLGKKILYVRNAGERLLVDDITRPTDSIIIRLPFFESQIHAVLKDGKELDGVYQKRLADGYQFMPLRAYLGQDFRFPVRQSVIPINVTGRWAVMFQNDSTHDSTVAVGEFVQRGNHVTGTFLLPTGDYRYLEGIADGDSLKLSCFDGGHAYLFIARADSAGNLEGWRFSGPDFKERWLGEKNEQAKLPDEFSLTKMKTGKSRFRFSFPDINGKIISIQGNRYKNKVVILQLMGSWCPNCMDETAVLSQLYDASKNKGVDVIALAYERSTNFARSQKSLRSFQKRFNLQYELLITGVSVDDSLRTEKTLPQLQNIEGFPTTIFIGKDGRVGKIHTGFNGPGTGAHFDLQKKEFYGIVDELLAR